MFNGNKKGIQAHTIWLTGLSGSGKTTLANEFSKNYMILDGDAIRKGLCSDLGFSDKDRKENMRRLIELCKLLNDNHICVITAFISPFEEERAKAKEEIDNCFIVYCNSDLKTCERRDVKGLYRKARLGEIENFTGIDSEYEIPAMCDLILDTQNTDIEECINNLTSTISKLI